MTPPAPLARAFVLQAEACRQLGSDFMGQLCDLLATTDWPTGRLTELYFNWQGDLGPSAQSLPLRLAGGLHALVLRGHALAQVYPPHVVTDAQLWDAVQTTLTTEEDFLYDWVQSAPQTNEVRRSAVLIAVGHVLTDHFGLPMQLSELGASGGLNLMWDRFALQIGDQRFGDAASDVVLSPEWDGPLPPACPPDVIERRGVDLNPLDPRDASDSLRLQAYLWPDQPERLTRTRAAIARADAVVDRADAIDWLATRLPHKAGRLHLIYSTIAWQYFPTEAQARGRSMIEAAGATATQDSPLAWFAMEPDGVSPGAGMVLRIWPQERTMELGRVDFHGRWVKWKGWS